MKAILERRKPIVDVKTGVEKPTRSLHAFSADHVYAILRRIGERVSDLERRTGENRRDIGRIEQKIRRDGLRSPSSNPQSNEDIVSGLNNLYGINEGR